MNFIKDKKLKIFLITFILSLPFWWGANILSSNLESFWYWQEIAGNPQILAAQMNQQILEMKAQELKIKKTQAERLANLEIEAKAVISVEIDRQGNEKILFEKNSQQPLPIASLTKLMTANIVAEYFDLNQSIKISPQAIQQPEDFGELKPGQVLTVKNLLYVLLIESSNDAAFALAEIMGQEGFVGLMNSESKDLGLKNTYFGNPTGLNFNDEDLNNHSSAEDLVKLTKYLLEKRPLLREIFGLREYNLYLADGRYHHKLLTTNEFLREPSVWQNKIIGGKTGETRQAGDCLLLVLDTPNGFLINVILGAEDRVKEMKKLLNAIYVQ